MKEFEIKIDGDMPEEHSIHIKTNGSQGVDGGHGGFFEFKVETSCNFKVFPKGETIPISVDSVRIITDGDLETDGWVKSLIRIGRELEKKILHLRVLSS